MSIAKITRTYVRRYRDNGSIVAYVEWVDGAGKAGRTEGQPTVSNNPRRPRNFHFGTHMHLLVQRASREGVRLQREVW